MKAATTIIVRKLFLAASWAAVLGLAACSDSRSPTDSGALLAFTADRAPVVGSFFLRQAPAGGDRLRLELVANEVQDVETVSLVLEYPGRVLDYRSSGGGDFLGSPTFLLVTPVPIVGGQLLVLANPVVSGSGGSGSGVVFEVEFEVVGEGSGAVRISGPEALDTDGDPIPDLQWIGGRVEARN